MLFVSLLSPPSPPSVTGAIDLAGSGPVHMCGVSNFLFSSWVNASLESCCSHFVSILHLFRRVSLLLPVPLSSVLVLVASTTVMETCLKNPITFLLILSPFNFWEPFACGVSI